jgi:hypothetical protein
VSAVASAPRLVTAAPTRSVVPALAIQEARRLLLHPLTLLGFGIYVVATATTVVGDYGPRSAFETASMVLTFYPGVLLILVGNLLATRDHRAGGDELLDPLPGRQEERVKAIGLASLAPALVGLCLTLSLHTAYLVMDRYASVPEGVPGPWHLLSGPVTLTGACLFGLMLGVWSTARVTAVVGVVAIVVANVWVDGQDDLRLLGPAFGWARWGLYADQWAGLFDGSPVWHVLYLVGLGAMAFAAAWVRVAARRGPVVVLGLLSLALAVSAGLLQMPVGP